MHTCFLAVFKPSAIESAIQPFANSPTALCKRSMRPTGFPHWLSPPPQGAVQTLWSICPSVLIYYHAKNKRSMVAKKYFLPLFCKQKSKPLTACFMHDFCKSPTEHLPRGRAVGTRPTRGFRGFPLTSGYEKSQSGCPYPILASERFRTEYANLEVSIFQNLPSLLVDFFSFVRMDISSFFLPCVGFYNLLDYPTTS